MDVHIFKESLMMNNNKLVVSNEEFLDTEYDEVIELESPVEIVEEYLNVDNSLIEMEKNKDLIRMEMNIVEYPIFSKNKRLKKNQIMKYHFKTDDIDSNIAFSII